jgi:murein DD-endopeptidase MepM/ murein hydrolase activator NlpD
VAAHRECASRDITMRLLLVAAVLWERFRHSTLTAVILVALTSGAISAHADGLPRESRVPGGIALITVAPAAEPKPLVTRDGANVWTVKRGGSWIAVLGLPLSTAPGEHSISVSRDGAAQSVPFTVQNKRYPVQHVTLKDNAMVDPPQEVMARIEAESAHLKSVRSNWRDTTTTHAAFTLPAIGRLSGRFGGSRVLNGKPRAPHAGLDVAIGTGTPVLAPGDGVILDIGDYYFCGKTMFIDHGNGLLSLFCHLSEHTAKVGDQVRKGQAVARSGATGRASGPHLHWSVYLNGVSVEPELFVNIKK